jgi:hypothetical protein
MGVLNHELPWLDGDRGAQYVRDAFLKLPNIALMTKTVALDTSEASNSGRVLRAIDEAANRLKAGDNFIFYIDCHGGYRTNASGMGTLVLGLSRSGSLWQYSPGATPSADLFASWFTGGVWDHVHKLFIMDCCDSARFWGTPWSLLGTPLGKSYLAGLDDAGILAACAEGLNADATDDTNHPFAHWGVLGQSLVRALDSLSAAKMITFDELVQRTKEMGASMAQNGGTFYGTLEDLSTNFAVNATCVWAPVATNTSDFVMNLVLTANMLTITYSGNQVIVSWPSSVTGWTLQTNGNLSTGNWVNYGSTIINNTVTNSPATGNLFFRLTHP